MSLCVFGVCFACARRGKFFSRPLYDFARLYPQWEAFAALRAELDPNGIFLNPFLRSLFVDADAHTERD